MATFETTASEINASPLMSFQILVRKAKNNNAGLPYQQSLALIAVGFHYDLSFQHIKSTNHETSHTQTFIWIVRLQRKKKCEKML